MQSSYVTTFVHQFGRYRFTRLPIGVALVGDMFQHKIDHIFKHLPNVFGLADDILIVGYDFDSKDQNRTLRGVMQICYLRKFKD